MFYYITPQLNCWHDTAIGIALLYVTMLIMTFLPSWRHHRLNFLTLWVHVCKEKAMLSYTGHTGYEIAIVLLDVITAFCAVREFSTSQAASLHSHSRNSQQRLWNNGRNKSSFIRSCFCVQGYFFFLADIHQYVYIVPVPLLTLWLFGVYKLGVMKVSAQTSQVQGVTNWGFGMQ